MREHSIAIGIKLLKRLLYIDTLLLQLALEAVSQPLHAVCLALPDLLLLLSNLFLMVHEGAARLALEQSSDSFEHIWVLD